jgi:hypothetical protein
VCDFLALLQALQAAGGNLHAAVEAVLMADDSCDCPEVLDISDMPTAPPPSQSASSAPAGALFDRPTNQLTDRLD